jgi:hypothetical protein
VALATYHAPRPIRRGLVAHVVAVAILTAAFLATGTVAAAALVLPLTLVGAPWSLLPWLMAFSSSYQSYQGFQLMLIAAAGLNVGLHALGARHWVIPTEMARRPHLLIAAVAASALPVSIPLAAYSTFFGGGPTAPLLILLGGVCVPVSVAAGFVRRYSSSASSSS